MRGLIRGLGEAARYFVDGREVTRDEFFGCFPPVDSLHLCICGHVKAAHEGHTYLAGQPEPSYCSAGCPCRQYEEQSGLYYFKPLASDALAVHPRQVEEATRLAKERGVPTEFLPDGRPVFTSSRHFREYARKHGFEHRGYP